jgi:hypothetical protein
VIVLQHLSAIEEFEVTVEANLIRARRLMQSILMTAFSERLAAEEPEECRS